MVTKERALLALSADPACCDEDCDDGCCSGGGCC
jgi:hypothetical protein